MKAKIYTILLFMLTMNHSFSQTGCDSISFSPDTLYINELTDVMVVDTMHWTGETELGFAFIDFEFEDTTVINITDNVATHGVWGSYTFVSSIGFNVIYHMADIPANTVVHAMRRVQHHNLQAPCMKPVTFIINPVSQLAVNNVEARNDFKVYPNPSSKGITLELDAPENQWRVVVTDLLGRVQLRLDNL